MKQIIPRTISFISYTKRFTYWAAISGGNGLSDTFGGNIAVAPTPWNCTVRNLVAYAGVPLPQNITVRVLKNNVATGLEVTLLAGLNGPVSLTGLDVSFSQFDFISYETETPSGTGYPGYDIGVCIEVESIGNIFGVCSSFGVINPDTGGCSGAFGNGIPGGNPFASNSSSYSITAVNGNVTTIVLASPTGTIVPVGATWEAYLFKNNVLQDGSGGTVDTRCIMTAGNTTAVSTFSLPVVLGDIVTVAYKRTGLPSEFGIPLAIGIGFVPTVDGEFMLCGGDNNLIAMPLGYVWTYAKPGATTEPITLAPIGLSGLVATGLYVIRSATIDIDGTATHTLRKSEAGTSIVVPISGLATEGLITGQNVIYVNGDTISLQIVSTPDFDIRDLHWGLAATVNVPITTGTIIINKSTNPVADPTIFQFNAGGGLIPAVFSLSDGQTRIYNNVPIGTYSIEEIVPSEWTVGYSVSNGSPINAISLNAGEIVIINVSNTRVAGIGSGIYELIENKRQDTLWVDTTLGTTREAKIP